ncbi:MAG: hypothetical protein BGO31_05155 [Bacteroidetes bacterium 43-16]|nr:MAG: hypothetical protein BGO31_05155 [Bacteroidetes bacterium 43-16]
MEFIVEAIIWIFFEYLLQMPGAAIRWLYHLGRKPFKTILKDEPGYNTAVGIGGLMIVIILIIIILNQ